MSNKPVSSPSAQSTQTVTQPLELFIGSQPAQYQVIDNGQSQQIDNAVQWIINGNLPYQERILLILLLRNGLRVSEITNPGNIRIIDKWSASVYCPKNKTYRICHTAEAAQIIEQYSAAEQLQYWNRNRFYYYRILKNLLPNVDSQRTGNKAVTHAARNIRAQMTFEATNSAIATTAAVGNKTIGATSHYVKRPQKRAFIEQGIQATTSGTIGNINATRTGVVRKKRKS